MKLSVLNFVHFNGLVNIYRHDGETNKITSDYYFLVAYLRDQPPDEKHTISYLI